MCTHSKAARWTKSMCIPVGQTVGVSPSVRQYVYLRQSDSMCISVSQTVCIYLRQSDSMCSPLVRQYVYPCRSDSMCIPVGQTVCVPHRSDSVCIPIGQTVCVSHSTHRATMTYLRGLQMGELVFCIKFAMIIFVVFFDFLK